MHTPLTPQTKGLVGEKLISSMKKSSILINAARGGVVDEQALIQALTENKIAAAALDVFEQEPFDPSSRFNKYGKCFTYASPRCLNR